MKWIGVIVILLISAVLAAWVLFDPNGPLAMFGATISSAIFGTWTWGPIIVFSIVFFPLFIIYAIVGR